MIKQCTKCGGEGPFGRSSYTADKLQRHCLKCRRDAHTAYRQRAGKQIKQAHDKWVKANHEHLKPYYRKRYYKYRMTPKGRAQWLLIAARKRAGKEKVTISRESIIKAIENGVCQITGLPFDLTTPHGPYSPSLDRTNSDGDYTDENTKVVVLIYNSAKSEWHHNDVVAMARALTMNEINAPVSAGDVVDRLSILTIKMVRMKDPVKLENVKREHNLLRELFDKIYTDLAAHLQMQFAGLSVKLRNVNEKIWDIEDGIRDHERNKDFGPSFVELARGVYHNNDERADLKKEINALVGSNIVEEKSYTDYK